MSDDTDDVGARVVTMIRKAKPDKSGVRRATTAGNTVVVTAVLPDPSSPAGHWLIMPRGQKASILPVTDKDTWRTIVPKVRDAIEAPTEAHQIALAELRDALAELAGVENPNLSRRDDAIRQCLEVGVGPNVVSRVSGLHRMRLWQIRNAP